jgi:hypothetical protein
MSISDNDFTAIQLERRSVTISAILKKCLNTLDGVQDEKIKLTLRKQINQSLIDAYNTGFTDSQNETKDSFKL